LHVQNVITLSSHTKEGNPTESPLTLRSNSTPLNASDVLTQDGAQQLRRTDMAPLCVKGLVVPASRVCAGPRPRQADGA